MTRFRCRVSDPPWSPRDQLLGPTAAPPGRTRAANRAFPRFPLPSIADQAVLFLWRLASMQPDALVVAEAWGFRVVSKVV